MCANYAELNPKLSYRSGYEYDVPEYSGNKYEVYRSGKKREQTVNHSVVELFGRDGRPEKKGNSMINADLLQSDDRKSGNYYCGGNSSLALRGMQLNNTPLSVKFFSQDNTDYIQKQIKMIIYRKSKGKIVLDEDQDEADLLICMRAIFLEHSLYLPDHVEKQIKILNKKTLLSVIPDIITNIKQDLQYQKEISRPAIPMDRPMNVNSAGRKTLPSFTNVLFSVQMNQ